MKEMFLSRRFSGDRLKRINQANEILAEYASAGYRITLRQLYYQYVAKGLIANNIQEYKRLGDLISKARLAGLIDWDIFTDETRALKGWGGGYDDTDEYMSTISKNYYVDAHIGQENYVEVWVEKQALISIVERPSNRWRVKYFACKGYSSQSEQYEAGKRFAAEAYAGKSCHILHLGDHDPSGIDMTRDNADRLDMFSGGHVEVHRIALNMNQVEELKPPPNPAKMTDSRVGNYLALYGKSSWELDALRPEYIDSLIDHHIRGYIDVDLFQKRLEFEKQGKETIDTISDRYDEILEYLRNN